MPTIPLLTASHAYDSFANRKLLAIPPVFASPLLLQSSTTSSPPTTMNYSPSPSINIQSSTAFDTDFAHSVASQHPLPAFPQTNILPSRSSHCRSFSILTPSPLHFNPCSTIATFDTSLLPPSTFITHVEPTSLRSLPLGSTLLEGIER
ncbi:hypothetical protein KSP39_PZI022058 [Platanthera zijinensis]|uniref:Uncharacterized protein n=1 Tax=Platanthera zijinensis TaxID=2320716 RepID=A0AAP0FVK4_9ASPA